MSDYLVSGWFKALVKKRDAAYWVTSGFHGTYSRLLDKGLKKPVCPTHQEAVTEEAEFEASLDFRARLWGGGVKPLVGSAVFIK